LIDDGWIPHKKLTKQQMASHWQNYIDSNIVKSRYFTHGAIHGLNGAKWAQSSGIDLSKSNVLKLLNILEEERTAKKQKQKHVHAPSTLSTTPISSTSSAFGTSKKDIVLNIPPIEKQQTSETQSPRVTSVSGLLMYPESQSNSTSSLSSTTSTSSLDLISQRMNFLSLSPQEQLSAASSGMLSLSKSSKFTSNMGRIGMEIRFSSDIPYRIIQLDSYSCLLATWNQCDELTTTIPIYSPKMTSPKLVQSPKVAPSDNSPSFVSVFDVENSVFLSPPTHVFYVVTTTKCVLIGRVNWQIVISESQNQPRISVKHCESCKKTLDKFADYLIESGF